MDRVRAERAEPFSLMLDDETEDVLREVSRWDAFRLRRWHALTLQKKDLGRRTLEAMVEAYKQMTRENTMKNENGYTVEQVCAAISLVLATAVVIAFFVRATIARCDEVVAPAPAVGPVVEDPVEPEEIKPAPGLLCRCADGEWARADCNPVNDASCDPVAACAHACGARGINQATPFVTVAECSQHVNAAQWTYTFAARDFMNCALTANHSWLGLWLFGYISELSWTKIHTIDDPGELTHANLGGCTNHWRSLVRWIDSVSTHRAACGVTVEQLKAHLKTLPDGEQVRSVGQKVAELFGNEYQ